MQAILVFTFAYQSGFNMLEMTLVALQDITMEKVFDLRRPGEEEPVRGVRLLHGAGVCVHPWRPVRVWPQLAGVVR